MNKKVLNAAMLVGLLAAGVAVAGWILTSAPKPVRIKPEVKARLVDVLPIETSQQSPYWQAGGEVQAAVSLVLQPRVSGRVQTVAVDAVPGAVLKAGAELVRLDTADFEAVVAQRQAALEQAQADLQIEQGQAALAADEYRMSGARLKGDDEALVLRKPQRRKAEAAVASARAALEQARLDLKYSKVTMPFTGQISSRSVAPGAQVSTSTELFSLVSTEHFWIEVKVPRAFLPMLDMQGRVTLSHPAWNGQTRHGRILHRLPDVDSSDRMARLLVDVEDPLALAASGPALLINDYVEVKLPGRELPDAIQVPLEQLDNQDRIWVVNNSTLQQRTLTVAWHGREYAWVTGGFEAGDQLLKGRVDAATPGMAVRVNQPASESGSAGESVGLSEASGSGKP